MMRLSSRSGIYLSPIFHASSWGTTLGVAAHTAPWTLLVDLRADTVPSLGCPTPIAVLLLPLFLGSQLSKKQPLKGTQGQFSNCLLSEA